MSSARDLLAPATPEDADVDPSRWRLVEALARELTDTDRLPALSLCVVRRNRFIGPLAFGRRRLADREATLKANDRFVVASLTKPIIAMAVLRLVEQGRLALNDRVSELVPEYRDASKRATTIRHLLTHTSGLPDALPNNLELRRAYAPLSEFVRGACDIPLDFPPGRGVQYQSLGYALLGEVIQRVSGQPCGQFLKDQFFDPLAMHSTSLGPLEPDLPTPIAEIRVPAEMKDGDDWNWNSPYWRQLGAPWGGLISTAADLARYAAMMLSHGTLDRQRVLSPATVASATRNQLESFHDLPEADRRTRAWGYGWRHNWLAHPACFSDLLPPYVYGHWGATGTLFWLHAETRTAAILLSSQPIERDRSPLIRWSADFGPHATRRSPAFRLVQLP
jgi:CubicO group peptidase (beta-lactamase class C family)